jgi:hypothetical protein
MESFLVSDSHAFRDAVFPTLISIPLSHLRVLDQFFRLADSTDPESGKQMSLLFVPNGIIKQPGTIKRGQGEISDRKSSWNTIASRNHKILDVFVSESDGINLMLHGEVMLGMSNGTTQVKDFVVRAVLVKHEDEPKLSSIQAWLGE